MKTFYLYLIVPFVMLLAFLYTPGVGYFSAQKQIAAKVAAKEAAAAAKEAEEARKRAEVEKRAQEDAQKRQEEREAEERRKAEKKENDYRQVIQTLETDIALYSGEADNLAKEASALELQLNNLRNQKETANRTAFDLAKRVEEEKIKRRNAELEIQRMVDMVATRLNASPLSAPPPPPPAAPAR